MVLMLEVKEGIGFVDFFIPFERI